MGRVQGVHTPLPPEITCGFLIQLVFCKKKKKIMWFIGVEVEQETNAPPSKKNPGSVPEHFHVNKMGCLVSCLEVYIADFGLTEPFKPQDPHTNSPD